MAIFGNYVENLELCCVAELNAEGKVLSIEEKQKEDESNCVLIGLYFYPNSVVEVAENIRPSARKEFEITSVNQHYLAEDNLHLQIMSHRFAWLDTGIHEALTKATEFVKAVEKPTGVKIASLEEIGYRMDRITKDEVANQFSSLNGNYYEYLFKVVL